MSNALTTEAQNANTLNLDPQSLVAKNFDENAAGNMVSGIDFMTRIQLNGSSANLAKKGLVPPGNYVLIKGKDQFVDLGKSVNAWICGLRLKALNFGGDPVVVFYDAATPEFQDIKAKADADPTNSGCLAGFEFLLYLPDVKPTPESKFGTFVTYFLCSKSARNEAPAFKALLGKTATLTAVLAENKKKQMWHVPKALTCTIPLAMPDIQVVQDTVNRFVNAMPSRVKKAEATEGGERPQ